MSTCPTTLTGVRVGIVSRSKRCFNSSYCRSLGPNEAVLSPSSLPWSLASLLILQRQAGVERLSSVLYPP